MNESSIGSFDETTEEGRSSDDSNSMQDKRGKRPDLDVGKGETRLVNRLRVLLFLVLALATVGVSVGVYKFTRHEEETNFEIAFLGASSKITQALSLNVEKQMSALESLAVTYTTYAKHHAPKGWPCVWLPGFERLVHGLLDQIQGLSILVNPVVTKEQRDEWEQFAQDTFHLWANESLEFQESGGYDMKYRVPDSQEVDTNDRQLEETVDVDFSSGIANKIYYHNASFMPNVDPTDGPYSVLWQNAPFVPGLHVENINMVSHPDNAPGVNLANNEMVANLGPTTNVEEPDPSLELIMLAMTQLIWRWGYEDAEVGKDPIGMVFFPIVDIFDGEPHTVASIAMYTHWRAYFMNLLPEGSNGIDAVFESTCSQPFTYRIDGPDVHYVSAGDQHDPNYDYLEQRVNIVEAFNAKLAAGTQYAGPALSGKNCDYTLRVYPTDIFRDDFRTNDPIFYTLGVVAIFVFAGLVFLCFDLTVERRQRLVMRNALKTNAIVTSLFPAAIADQMMAEEEALLNEGGYMSNKQRIKTFLNDGTDKKGLHEEEKPMADLFTDTTVMYADIVDFTAWSSSRDPSQVFLLLQTLYQAFDKIAHWRGVFKVETNGDSYVAVAGLPEKQPDHALRMARFALDCHYKANLLMKELEVKLGPDTGDLKMRFGLHSGPCTAGVLRGDRARFQLFGDTSNMARLLENSSLPNRIQLSKATAKLLQEAGRSVMVVPRGEEVHVKGKGLVQTFFLVPKKADTAATSTRSLNCSTGLSRSAAKKHRRLVAWNVRILSDQLKKVVARRQAVKGEHYKPEADLRITDNDRDGKTYLEEIEDVLEMPAFDQSIMAREPNAAMVDLGEEVIDQLKTFVEEVAKKYHANPFHNFEHASHVAMSVEKLLNRIDTPDIEAGVANAAMMALHDFTHGITSDPLVHFGVVLSALIHDVDHRGVGNNQMAVEDPDMAKRFKNKSIAEQNSVDVAWNILMQPQLKDLRACIYSDEEELHRFRQTIVKVVLATDIFDKELNDLRKQRWNMAFADDDDVSKRPQEGAPKPADVKATIVIEHLIQASDVCHTMQHWHIYRKWNERLFLELFKAHQAGRMGANPVDFWYKGELGFFDNYIIPLTQKLAQCNVFGVSSDEYLSYALANREEWERKGEQIVSEMVEKYCVVASDVLDESKASIFV